jgi:O-acetyl-ADP-ribose deacetylase (regulator of RNase III)
MSSIELIHGSVVDQEVDAIVNAANKELIIGSGVCGAIFVRAGVEELTRACSEIPTPLQDGDAVITPAFRITNAKKIIHAVGPNFALKKDAFPELENAYYNSLELLKENGLHSIAFPLISSGIYAGDLKEPAKESVMVLLDVINQFSEVNPDYDIDVKVCAYSDEEYEQIKDLF